MKIVEFKGKKLCNGLVAYNLYKKLTGRPLQADTIRLSKLVKVQEKLVKGPENISEEELKLFDEIDFIGITTAMYCAFRQAAEPELRKYSIEGVLDHDGLDMDDIGKSELTTALTELIGNEDSKK